MMNGGNILALQKILGHSTLNMTMKYAHLAPEHLQEAVDLNPLERKLGANRSNEAGSLIKSAGMEVPDQSQQIQALISGD